MTENENGNSYTPERDEFHNMLISAYLRNDYKILRIVIAKLKDNFSMTPEKIRALFLDNLEINAGQYTELLNKIEGVIDSD